MSGRHSRFPAVNRDVPPAERASQPEPVEPELAAAPEPEPEPAPAPEPVAEEVTEAVEADAPATHKNGYPEDGNIGAVLEWVGEDKKRANYARAEENKREHPRKGILDALGD